MIVERKPVNFQDARGLIQDIFVADAPECVTLITCEVGSVRGNHVHDRSTQHVFIVAGRLAVYTRVLANDSAVERQIVEAGDLFAHLPGEAHAYECLEATTMLAFADGDRRGESYEDDTRRIDSLIEAWHKDD